MTNKRLTLNDELKPFFSTENQLIWDLIIENKTEELQPVLSEEDEFINKILAELFTEGKSDTLDVYDFVTIKEPNSSLFRDLVRFIFASDINGNYDEIKESILNKIFDFTPDMIEQLQKETQGYPMRPVSEVVIKEASSIRMSLNTLAYYFVLFLLITCFVVTHVCRPSCACAVYVLHQFAQMRSHKAAYNDKYNKHTQRSYAFS